MITEAESFLRNAVTPAGIWQRWRILQTKDKCLKARMSLWMFVRTRKTFLKPVT